jgi:hypothetical protein
VLEQVSKERKNRPADGAVLWFGEPQLPALRFCSSTEAGIGPRLTKRNVKLSDTASTFPTTRTQCSSALTRTFGELGPVRMG